MNEANQRLAEISTQSQLRDLINQLSSESSGDITILYSGYVSESLTSAEKRISARDLALSMLENGDNIRMIENTEVGRFLDVEEGSMNKNEMLIDALKRIFNDDPAQYGSEANQFLYGEIIDGRRVNNGVWDSISARFVAATTGEVRTITGGAQADRAFAQTEVPAILQSTTITHVDGIPIEQLRKMTPEQAFDAIRAQSEIKTAEIFISVDDSGKPVTVEGSYRIDTRKFFADTPGIDGKAAPENIRLKPISEFIPAERIATHKHGADQLRQTKENLLNELDNLQDIGDELPKQKIYHALDRLGVAADIVDFAILALDIKKAHESGDTEEVKRVIADWTVETIGAFAAGKLAAMAVAPLLGAGPPGLLVAGAITIGASIAGGMYADDLLNLIKMMLDPWDDATQERLRRLYANRPWPASPLILDLNGDGVRTISLEEKPIYFDHDNNGFAERTGWVSKEDGLLIRDINGSGQIEGGFELFGNQTVLINGEFAANGFEALAELDTNGDQVVDSNDEDWDNLFVWQDADTDASLGEGELLSLQQAGVESLDINYAEVVRVDDMSPEKNGNQHRQLGSFTTLDDTRRDMNDVWFAANRTDSIDLSVVRVPQSISVLPNVSGLGNVSGLHQAMLRDESGELQLLVEDWVSSDINRRQALLEQIIYQWAGVQDVDPSLYQPLDVDARQFIALERFLGRPFQNGEADPRESARENIVNAFSILKNQVNLQLTIQTDVASLLSLLSLESDKADGQPRLDATKTIQWIESLFGEEAYTSRLLMMSNALKAMNNNVIIQKFIDVLHAEATKLDWPTSSALMLLAADRFVEGTLYNDYLQAFQGDELIDGKEGDDQLWGGDGNDTIHGGKGDDFLSGKDGDNMYVFGMGDGKDIVDAWYDFRADKLNRLLLKPGIDEVNLKVTTRGEGEHLLLGIEGTDDEILIYEFIPNNLDSIAKSPIQEIRFSDGKIWTVTDVLKILHGGSDSDDYLRGSMADDSITGGVGSDTINGEDGDDTLAGNSGDDILYGGYGSDVFLFSRGDGADIVINPKNDPHHSIDRIFLGDDIAQDDITISRVDLGLLLSISGEKDSITIEEFFEGSSETASLNVEVHFSDGSVWQNQDFISRVYVGGYVYRGGDDLLEGDPTSEYLFGGEGDDTIIGNMGNDTLVGGEGFDIFIFARGDGNDTITNSDTSAGEKFNSLNFAADIGAGDLLLQRVDEDLLVSLMNTEDSVLITDFFFDNDPYSPRNPIQQIRPGIEKPMDVDDIVRQTSNLQWGTSQGDYFKTTRQQDYIHGLRGNDTFIGSLGNDLLDGGSGVDTVSYVTMRDMLSVDLSTHRPQETGAAGIDTLISIENLLGGRYSDFLRGSLADNYIDGRRGDDTIEGGEGDDILIGGPHSSQGDTVSYANATEGVFVKINSPSTPFDTIGAGHDILRGFENIIGSNFNDTLQGDWRDNSINGLDGNDVIHDGGGADVLTGGPGADKFMFSMASFKGVKEGDSDRITDFEQIDIIDLSMIDANLSVKGDQAFTFVGAEEFRELGQLRYVIADGIGMLQGNIVGDNGTDFQVDIVGGLAIVEHNIII